jgi:sugar lactone lactonase YvrE
VRSSAARAVLFWTALALGHATPAQALADPVAAEQQYRLAQRLGADRSADAPAAFARVVALAPDGPFADDALVDLACLSGLPDWPEEVAVLDATRAAAAVVPLEKVVNSYANGDRALEARYRLALIRIAPITGRDEARARRELIALAATPSRGRWVVAARYALGVLDEQAGATSRAAGTFARIVVERAGSDVGPRAAAGFGRTLLAAGAFGPAAGWFQEAIESGVPPALRAGSQRDLAVRELLSARVPGRRWVAVAAPLHSLATTRGASLLTTAADGRLVVFDRKNDTLQVFDANGNGAPPLLVPDVTSLATDPFGRVYMATKDKLLRWDASGPTTVTMLESFGAPAAIAVDASGTVWIADRKGDRVARWVPGTQTAVLVRESKGAGVAALAVVGGRVIAAEEKLGRVVVVAGPGSPDAFGTATFRRPVALAADGAGRLSVLDEKAETLTRLNPSGDVSDTLLLRTGGVSHPLAIATAPDGAVRILDGSTGAVAVAP